MGRSTSESERPPVVPASSPFRPTASDAILAAASAAILLSTVLEWINVHGAAGDSTFDISTTAWELGVLGGVGLAMVAVIALVIALGWRRKPPLAYVMLTLILLAAIGMTTFRAISLHAGDPTVQRSHLSLGFYISMVAANGLLLSTYLGLRTSATTRRQRL